MSTPKSSKFIIPGSLTIGDSTSDTHKVTGSFHVSGNMYATEYHVQILSSSIIYASGSTKFGDSADDFHQFTGSMTILGSVSSSAGFTGDGSALTNLPGGGTPPGGSDTQIQFNSGSSFSGSSNLVYNYDANTLSFTGTLLLSSSDGIPIRVGEDEDATIIVGEAALGNGGNTGVAYACHKDHTGASSAGFQQKLLGEVRLNAVNTKAIIFAANGSEKASFNQQAVANLGYFGLGPFGFVPAVPLDVKGSTNFGRESSHSHHFTGSLSISGAFGIQLSKSSDATINLDSTTDYYVVCTLDGAVTVNLPAAASAIQGSMFIIKDGLGTNRASGGKEITVSSSGDASDVIDGAAGVGGYGSQLQIDNPFGADQFISDGVNTWYSY
jgi:hypothetical protein